MTGAAVLTSGITAIAGFAVLIVSRIEMLRQFGLVTLVDLTVSLAGVLVVLPAVLALADRRRVDPEPARPAPMPRAERAAATTRAGGVSGSGEEPSGPRTTSSRGWIRTRRAPERARLKPEHPVPPGGDLEPPSTGSAPGPVIDTRRYQRMIGLIGLALVAALSVYLFVNHRGSSTTGVTAGHRLRWFAAPLATSDLQRRRQPASPVHARHDTTRGR